MVGHYFQKFASCSLLNLHGYGCCQTTNNLTHEMKQWQCACMTCAGPHQGSCRTRQSTLQTACTACRLTPPPMYWRPSHMRPWAPVLLCVRAPSNRVTLPMEHSRAVPQVRGSTRPRTQAIHGL
jgi:hypothetical protein